MKAADADNHKVVAATVLSSALMAETAARNSDAAPPWRYYRYTQGEISVKTFRTHIATAVAIAMALVGHYTAAAAEEVEKDAFESWGLGVAAAVEFFDGEYIETATTQGDSRLVVVEKATKSQPAVWAVGNWTLDQCLVFKKCDWVKPGLFFGLKLAGETGVGFEGLGIGLQLAFVQNAQLRSGEPGKKPSWNIGVGWVNHRTREFAKGIVAGEPLPADFQDIRYKESWDSGWMIMVAKNVY